MAKSSQFTSVSSSSGVGGGSQAVVELCGTCGQGLIFWARQRFEVGVELQVRLRAEVLPPLLKALVEENETGGEWVMLRGFVVQCLAERRRDGSCGFQVSLLVAGCSGGLADSACGLCSCPSQDSLFIQHDWLGGHRLGLN